MALLSELTKMTRGKNMLCILLGQWLIGFNFFGITLLRKGNIQFKLLFQGPVANLTNIFQMG